MSQIQVDQRKIHVLYLVNAKDSPFPFCPKRHFLQRSRPLQSQTTALLLHTMFRLQERFDQFNISLNYVYKYPVSIRYC